MSIMVAQELVENNVQGIKRSMKRYVELMNEHYKGPVKGLFDDAMASVLKALVYDKPRSNMEVDVGKCF